MPDMKTETGDSPHVLALEKLIKQWRSKTSVMDGYHPFIRQTYSNCADELTAELERLRGVETRWQDIATKKALATAFTVWHKWKSTLPDGAFSHDDGVRFVAMLTQAMPTPLPPAPSTRGPEGV